MHCSIILHIGVFYWCVNIYNIIVMSSILSYINRLPELAFLTTEICLNLAPDYVNK